jgi:fumarate hydratase class I
VQNIAKEIVELIRFTSTDLPEDVTSVLKKAYENEELGSAAHGAFETILKNVEMTRRDSTPICQDTGTPLFFVSYGEGWNPSVIKEQIRTAVAEATKKSYLRPNAVEAIGGSNTGNNLGDENFPTIHFEEKKGNSLVVDLMLKGGGCENVGAQYSLPDTALNAGRDLEGVRKVVLDAVFKAQGQGCAPGFLGVAIGGDRGSGYLVSKQALLKKLNDENSDPALARLAGRQPSWEPKFKIPTACQPLIL